MSDTRFTIIGIILIFAGFIILGTVGSQFVSSTVESDEFDDCYEYFDDKSPVKVNCDTKAIEKSAFFGLVIGLIAAGVFSLIKGVKGDWDQKVKPDDLVGPGGENSQEKEKSDSDN